MNSRALKGIAALLFLCLGSDVFAGYRSYLDPRSMAMGGAGVASSTKFNASFHNPALIAFSRGDKPDKIYIHTSFGARELYDHDFQDDVREFQDSDVLDDFVEAVRDDNAPNNDELIRSAEALKSRLRAINLNGYRADETTAFSLMVDTKPVTINFYTTRDIREMVTIRARDEALIDQYVEDRINDSDRPIADLSDTFQSSVDNTYYEIREFGVTVATTNVIEYNMPISWGFTPKWIQINGSHISDPLQEYDVSSPPDRRISTDLIEWNLDVGFALLMTDDFMQDVLGLDGYWLEGETVFGIVGKNMFPTDFTPWRPVRPDRRFPAIKRAVQALYRVGLAHYREKYMMAIDLDLSENEVWDFEGLTRFLSLGGEYYWRDDFHLRGGLRFNLAQTSEAAKDQASLTAGFLYQPKGFSVEGAAMINEVEMGGTIGFGLAF